MLAKCLDGTEIFESLGDLMEPRIKGGGALGWLDTIWFLTFILEWKWNLQIPRGFY